MAENYKPKKVQAGKVQVKSVACPNCHEMMSPEGLRGFVCLNRGCRLFDVRYKVTKVLATMERE